jgi:hypothetical protein
MFKQKERGRALFVVLNDREFHFIIKLVCSDSIPSQIVRLLILKALVLKRYKWVMFKKMSLKRKRKLLKKH